MKNDKDTKVLMETYSQVVNHISTIEDKIDELLKLTGTLIQNSRFEKGFEDTHIRKLETIHTTLSNLKQIFHN